MGHLAPPALVTKGPAHLPKSACLHLLASRLLRERLVKCAQNPLPLDCYKEGGDPPPKRHRPPGQPTGWWERGSVWARPLRARPQQSSPGAGPGEGPVSAKAPGPGCRDSPATGPTLGGPLLAHHMGNITKERLPWWESSYTEAWLQNAPLSDSVTQFLRKRPEERVLEAKMFFPTLF